MTAEESKEAEKRNANGGPAQRNERDEGRLLGCSRSIAGIWSILRLERDCKLRRRPSATDESVRTSQASKCYHITIEPSSAVYVSRGLDGP